MVLGRRMERRFAIAALASMIAAIVAVVEPAAAAILFTCDTVTGSATMSLGLAHNKHAESLSSGPSVLAAEIVLASTSDAGVKANGGNSGESISADGTAVAFGSSATNLDPADTDTTSDIYVKHLNTGEIVLASTSDAGVKGNGDSEGDTSMAANGTAVAFDSRASNLDVADTDTTPDIYVKSLSTGDIALASTSDSGTKANGKSFAPSLSADGTRVAFFSEATNLDPLDTDTGEDIYVKNLSTGDIALASTSDAGVKANNASPQAPSVSADGTRVAFISRASNLDPADVDIQADLFVKDLVTGDVVVASTSDTGTKANMQSDRPRLSDDGTAVAFSSFATNLDPADTDTTPDIYVKDLATGDITLASTSDTGTKANQQSFMGALNEDGTVVGFTSFAYNLDPAASSGGQLLGYLKDLSSGDLVLASANDAGVKANGPSGVDGLSDDGTVALVSGGGATNYDLADTDGLGQVYLKHLPGTPTSVGISSCSNGQTATVSLSDVHSYGARPLGCPESLGGGGSNDYPDQTPILLGANPSLQIDWAAGPDSFGVAKLKMGTNGTQWRVVLAIQSSPGHDTPATNQYLPASGSGFTKTKLKGRIDWSAFDSFDCTSNTANPISWMNLVNNGAFIVKNA
jgi:hypothetical protein